MPGLAVRQINEQERTVELSFSSEAPVKRWFGSEVLCHDDGSVDMGRLTDIGILLFNHDSSLPMGRVLSCEIDAEQHKGRAVVQFDTDEMSDWYFQKVLSGTLKGVSVGYRVDVWEVVEANATSTNGRFTGPVELAVKWTPYEISIVSVPADASVGVGRSAESSMENVAGVDTPAVHETRVESSAQESNAGRQEGNMPQGKTNEAAVDPQVLRQEAVDAERQRSVDITALCREFSIDNVDEFIARGDTVDQVRKAALDILKERNKPGQTAGVNVTQDVADTFRAALPHAMIMRAGMDLSKAGVEKPHAAARELRGMSIRAMMEEHCRHMGIPNASRMTVDELVRSVFTPDSQFASVLDNTIGHSMMIGHQAAGTTYQLWTGVDSNKDFKPTPKFRTSAASEPEEVGQNGEMAFDEISDEGVYTQISTFGKRWAFSRQALINDDLDVLTKVPMQYAIALERMKNRRVYQILNTNPAIYDGRALFDTVYHKNLAATPAYPSVISVGVARKAMGKQMDIDGKQILNIQPRFVICGLDADPKARQLMLSQADPGSTNSGVANIENGRLVVITDGELAVDLNWFTAADPRVIDTISVAYLNGQAQPTIESKSGWETLGMEWRLYGDFGVTVLDYRGLFKNDGSAT